MRHKLIIDGNAVYEMDDECLRCQEEERKKRQEAQSTQKQQKKMVRKESFPCPNKKRSV